MFDGSRRARCGLCGPPPLLLLLAGVLRGLAEARARPNSSSLQQARGDSADVAERRAAKDSCPARLNLQSATTVAQREMGDYELTDVASDFPVYQRTPGTSGNASYIYFYQEFSNWRVGYDYMKPHAELTSTRTTVECPSEVVKWFDRRDGSWQLVSDMNVAYGDNEVDVASALDSAEVTVASALDAASSPSSSSMMSSPGRAHAHSYTDVGEGYCQDAAGKRMPSYSAEGDHISHHFCQAQCDSDTNCVAFNAVERVIPRGANCTLWVQEKSAHKNGWIFQEGNGATSVSQGMNDKHLDSMANTLHLLGTNADVFCMLKDTGPTASEIEGPGVGFWVYWLVLPVTCLCSAMVIMVALGGSEQQTWPVKKAHKVHKGKKVQHAHHIGNKMEHGTDSGMDDKPFLMSHRPMEAQGDA